MCVCSRAHVCVCARARVRVCVSPGLRRPSPRVATAAVVSLSLSVWYVGVCLCVCARVRVCVCSRARVCVGHVTTGCDGPSRPGRAVRPPGLRRPSPRVTTAAVVSRSLSRSDRTASSTDAAVVVCRRMEVGARVGGHACVHRPVRVSRQPRGARLTPVRPEFRTKFHRNFCQACHEESPERHVQLPSRDTSAVNR